MATVLNTLYPPQVATFMPSFRYDESATIWFDISSYNDELISSIKFIHVSMVDQRNNKNVFMGKNEGNTVYPQFYPVQFNQASMWDEDEQLYKFTIPPQVLKTTPYYNVGQYYKVQLRFDLTGSTDHPAYSSAYTDPTEFFSWDGTTANANALQLANYANFNQDNFSEWSAGTLIKAILIPSISIRINNQLPEEGLTLFPSTDCGAVGKLIFTRNAADTTSKSEDSEWLSWYKFSVRDNSGQNVLYTWKTIYPDTNVAINEINYRLDLSSLEPSETQYVLRIDYGTNNGYINYVDYTFMIVDYTAATDVTCTANINEEDGIVTLSISELDKYTTGYLVIRRSSHRSNFTHWDLITARDISSLSTLTITDNTLESLTGYRYQLQYMTEDTIYSPIYVESDDIIHCDFYGGLLSDLDYMLRISFDFQVASRSNAINRSKVDTIGGQYPRFTQNSKLKYHTYNLSGKISTEDNGELFLPKEEVMGEEYYNYRYNPSAELPHNVECQRKIKPHNDWLYEREYRDAVEEWLNNGKPKLFRSMTEGNMIVMLDMVSLSPDTVLGRRLYSFTATMYEIGDGKNLDSLSSLGIFETIDER